MAPQGSSLEIREVYRRFCCYSEASVKNCMLRVLVSPAEDFHVSRRLDRNETLTTAQLLAMPPRGGYAAGIIWVVFCFDIGGAVTTDLHSCDAYGTSLVTPISSTPSTTVMKSSLQNHNRWSSRYFAQFLTQSQRRNQDWPCYGTAGPHVVDLGVDAASPLDYLSAS